LPANDKEINILTNFAELGLSKPILAALEAAGITEPTEIQEATIQQTLTGRDLLASAQTGSGKTAAFALPIIECLSEPEKRPRALVLAPTRELALQVEEEFKRFAKNSGLKTVTLYGGTGYDKQLNALKRQVDIIVATPGRLLDCVERKYADLAAIEILVLDEADRLLDLGFMPQIRKIISKIPKERQTLMFSATIDQRIQKIAREYMIDPAVVRANVDRIDVASIEQRFLHVTEFSKDALLAKLIKEYEMSSILVFTRTKRKAGWVRDRLRDANIIAEEIHSDISQNQRERTLARYRKGMFPVLVATDVAARGLDIPTISHVINYDLPEVPEDYVHRIGRTGRAGRSGMAFSFVSEEQRFLVKDIQKLLGQQEEPESAAAAAKKTAAARRFKSRNRRRVI
jgi:ATP-dependent RNA helicase RhlE